MDQSYNETTIVFLHAWRPKYYSVACKEVNWSIAMVMVTCFLVLEQHSSVLSCHYGWLLGRHDLRALLQKPGINRGHCSRLAHTINPLTLNPLTLNPLTLNPLTL